MSASTSGSFLRASTCHRLDGDMFGRWIDRYLDNAKGIALGLAKVVERAPPRESTQPPSHHFDRLSNPRCPLGRGDAFRAAELLEVVDEPVEPMAASRGWHAEEEPFHVLDAGKGRQFLRERD